MKILNHSCHFHTDVEKSDVSHFEKADTKKIKEVDSLLVLRYFYHKLYNLELLCHGSIFSNEI